MPGRPKSKALKAHEHRRLHDQLMKQAVVLYRGNGTRPKAEHLSLRKVCTEISTGHQKATGQWVDLDKTTLSGRHSLVLGIPGQTGSSCATMIAWGPTGHALLTPSEAVPSILTPIRHGLTFLRPLSGRTTFSRTVCMAQTRSDLLPPLGRRKGSLVRRASLYNTRSEVGPARILRQSQQSLLMVRASPLL